MAVDKNMGGARSSLLRRLARWLARGILGILALLILAALTGAVYESIGRSSDEKKYPPPGRMVDIGTHRLHINCTGQGNPTVILEAGAGMWSNSWWWIQRDLAPTTRVCSYDRTGMGWSDPGPSPDSMDGIETAKELHVLLEKAGERGPFVYVGHSLGGMLARIYYDLYPGDLAGMVLIEPGEPEVLLDANPSLRGTEIKPCGSICTYGRIAARLGIVRLVLNHNKLVNDPKFSPDALAQYKARALAPQVLTTVLGFGRYLGAVCRETLENKSLGDLPLVVVRGTDFSPPFFPEDERERSQAEKQVIDGWSAIATLSSNNSPVVVVHGANHLTLVTYEEYATQISVAIRGVVEGARSRTK